MHIVYVKKREKAANVLESSWGWEAFFSYHLQFLLLLFSASCHVMSVIIRADKVPVYSLAAASHINVWSLSDQAAIMYLLRVCQAPWQLFSISLILAFMQLKSTPTLRGNWCDVH